MTRLVESSDWVPKGDIILESAAENAVKSKKHLLVVAGPGAGKTELLAQKTDYLFQTNLSKNPRKILAISFKKDAADNLKERIVKRYGNEYGSRFSSLTYDAFSKRILDQFRTALPEEFIPQKNYLVEDKNIIESVFCKYFQGFSQWKNIQKKSTIENALYKNMKSDIWIDLLRGSEDNKACLTFKMINILATRIIITNPKIKELLQMTYSHVFLDEFQDTTDLQYDLVRACFLNGDSIITAVGDNKQRIMEWAGARKTIFLDFKRDFNSDKVSLIMNHRSAPRLVDLQKRMYESLGENELEAHPSDNWSLDDGEIKLFISSDEKAEAERIVPDIVKKISIGVKVDDICILVKQTAEKYSAEIITLLKSYGVRARIENDFQDSLKQSVVLLILNIFKVSLNIQTADEWENLENFWLKITGLAEGIGGHTFDSVQTELNELIYYCQNRLNDISDKNDFVVLVQEIIKKLEVERICRAFPEYEQGNYLVTVLNIFVELFWKEYNSIDGFKVAIEKFQGKNTIPIMTIHKSKGLEYEAVYFVGLEDSAFWNFKNQPEADRSAFFVAISRAKRYMSFSYCEKRSNLVDYYNPSGNQKNDNINEFFDLLLQPGVATIVSGE